MQGIHTHFLYSCPPSLSPSMSTNGLPNTKNLCEKPTRRRRDSGEIDVFEAARYFSGGVDGVGLHSGVRFPAAVKEERVACRAERKSLDMFLETMQPQHHKKVEKHIKEKNSKQPSSPGARLASFLNSLFHQTASKKKAKSLKDEEGLAGRRRRFSIGHSQSIRSSESKYIYSSSTSTSGFRTPLSYTDAPTKSNNSSGEPKSVAWHDKRVADETWVPGKTRFAGESLEKNKGIGNGSLGKGGRLRGDGFAEQKWVLNRSSDVYPKEDRIWASKHTSKEIKQISYRKREEEDDVVSDSSSDLFELKNYDLNDPPSGLPVYGTTNMEAIKKEAAIAAASF